MAKNFCCCANLSTCPSEFPTPLRKSFHYTSSSSDPSGCDTHNFRLLSIRAAPWKKGLLLDTEELTLGRN